jgi:sugar/nucleoside kinase (ribokinase family)
MKILGIGNALVDILVQLNDDSTLQVFGLPKGSMTLVDKDLASHILIETAELIKKKASGGSAANTIHGLAHLGIETAFIGKVGHDELGSFFRENMEANHITTKLFNSLTDTGRAIAMISPDSERTFATYLGAAVELLAVDLSADHFSNFDLLYLEGYLVQNKELVEKALQLAKSANLRTCIDLASFNVVSENVGFLSNVIEQYVDIVFANDEEAKALTGFSPEEAIHALAGICDIAVIKMGGEGSIIKKGNELIRVEALPSRPIDTTGAGDLYAAGFIFGLSKNADLETCGKAGSLLAGKVIEGVGASMEESIWEMIRRKLPEYFK